MKIYGTVTSERASKGQGGEWLKIAIENEARKKVAVVHVNALYQGRTGITLEYLPEVYATDMPTVLLGQATEKGEKQKGETVEDITKCPLNPMGC